MATRYAKIRRELRDGDLLLFRNGGLIPWASEGKRRLSRSAKRSATSQWLSMLATLTSRLNPETQEAERGRGKDALGALEGEDHGDL